MSELWFDTRDGALLAGDDAVEPRLLGSGPGDVLPLREILEAEVFPFTVETFIPEKRHTWERQTLIEIGHWVLHVLNPPYPHEPDATPIKQKHLNRLSILRLGPSFSPIKTEFDTLWQFREVLGANGRENGKYDNWSFQDFIAYAASIEKLYGRKPTGPDYTEQHQQGNGPGIKQLLSRTGGVRNLNEHLGYPNVTDWEHDDFISWGVKTMDANDGLTLQERVLYVLSARMRGPSPATVKRRFGSLVKFQSLVEQERDVRHDYRHITQQDILEQFVLLREQGILPEKFDPYPAEKKAQIASKYAVAKKCLSNLPPSIYTKISTVDSDGFIAAIRGYNEQITAGEIELAAASIDAMDIIWPDTFLLEKLKISPKELSLAKLAVKEYGRKRMARKRAA